MNVIFVKKWGKNKNDAKKAGRAAGKGHIVPDLLDFEDGGANRYIVASTKNTGDIKCPRCFLRPQASR